jgi:uncharacterized membrane protein
MAAVASNSPARAAGEGVDFRWMALAALLGLGAASSSTWVHHQVLTDPAYASFCDVSSALSCTNAYTSRYGSFAGVPVALLGVLYFSAVLLMVAMGSSSQTARANIPGYVFALSVVGLAAVFYLGYASFAVLGTVCLLCVATYVAVVGLFVSAAKATRIPMGSLPARLSADFSTLLRSPSALLSTAAFAVAAAGAIWWFPAGRVDAAAVVSATEATQAPAQAPAALPASAVQELEKYLAAQQRVPVMVATEGAAVVLVKFNDYMCPPCGQTFAEYKPVLAKYAKEYPGKVKYVTRDYPLCSGAKSGC